MMLYSRTVAVAVALSMTSVTGFTPISTSVTTTTKQTSTSSIYMEPKDNARRNVIATAIATVMTTGITPSASNAVEFVKTPEEKTLEDNGVNLALSLDDVDDSDGDKKLKLDGNRVSYLSYLSSRQTGQFSTMIGAASLVTTWIFASIGINMMDERQRKEEAKEILELETQQFFATFQYQDDEEKNAKKIEQLNAFYEQKIANIKKLQS